MLSMFSARIGSQLKSVGFLSLLVAVVFLAVLSEAQAGKVAMGKITGVIGGGVAKAKFPVPPSTVRAYRLYAPGYTAAVVIPKSGKYSLTVPPGPYAVLFDVWSPSGMPIATSAAFVWVKPGVSWTVAGEAPSRISVTQLILTDLLGTPYSPGGDAKYDYTGMLMAYLVADAKKLSLEVVEDPSLASYNEILSIIEKNSAADIPAEQRLDRDQAMAHLLSPGLSFKLQGTMKASSIGAASPAATDAPGMTLPTLQTNLEVFDQNDGSSAASEESTGSAKAAFDKAVDAQLKKLLKKLKDRLKLLPVPAGFNLNFWGVRIFDAWEKGLLDTAQEDWEVAPLVLKRNSALDAVRSSKDLQVAVYTLDAAGTQLSSTTWSIKGLGSVMYSGNLFEATNVESPSVVELWVEKVTKDATTQRYAIGGEIWEKTEVQMHVQSQDPYVDAYMGYNPALSVKGQGAFAPYTGAGAISVNATYEGSEPTSTRPVKWTYQLMSR